MAITKQFLGKTKDGSDVFNYTITSEAGSLTVSNLGASIQSIIVQDRDGNPFDVALGFDSVEAMEEQKMYSGATIGRCGNRLEKGILKIGENTYQLATNNGNNHLHGGPGGFHSRIWDCREDEGKLVFSRTSPDGEENYPGTMEVTVTFSFDDDGVLDIDYEASSDKDTFCNLTNHVYLNLSGHDSGSVADHFVLIDSEATTKINEECIPTGELFPVKGTALDFNQFREIGESIDSDEEQMRFGGGYDHNYTLPESNDGTVPIAEVYSPVTGIAMQVYTDLPGIQFYSGNHMQDVPVGKNGAHYGYRGGFCMETQYWPNASMHKNFPSPLLKAGETFKSTTTYEFGIRYS